MSANILKTKASMDLRLQRVRECVNDDRIPSFSLPLFEESLWRHLESLHDEIRGVREDARTAEAKTDQLLDQEHDRKAELDRKTALNATLVDQVENLTKKLDAKKARISQLKAWRNAAVRDNKRVRAENKAFRETQDELVQQVSAAVAEVKRLRMVLDV